MRSQPSLFGFTTSQLIWVYLWECMLYFHQNDCAQQPNRRVDEDNEPRRSQFSVENKLPSSYSRFLSIYVDDRTWLMVACKCYTFHCFLSFNFCLLLICGIVGESNIRSMAIFEGGSPCSTSLLIITSKWTRQLMGPICRTLSGHHWIVPYSRVSRLRVTMRAP